MAAERSACDLYLCDVGVSHKELMALPTAALVNIICFFSHLSLSVCLLGSSRYTRDCLSLFFFQYVGCLSHNDINPENWPPSHLMPRSEIMHPEKKLSKDCYCLQKFWEIQN